MKLIKCDGETMKLAARLQINGHLIRTFAMSHNAEQDKPGNQFTHRSWIQNLSVDPDDEIRVTIDDDRGRIATLRLEQEDRDDGKQVFTGSIDQGDTYSWATLTRGYQQTMAITARVLFRRTRPAPVEIQGTLFDTCPA